MTSDLAPRTANVSGATLNGAAAPAATAATAAGRDTSRDARYELSPHNCFACGTLNTHGLGLVLHVEHGRSWTELALPRSFQGWEGMAHGGIVCTILDEVMAWALVGADNWGVTARLNVDFRRPVSIGRPFHAEGTVTSMRRRVVETSGRIVDSETGEVLATATATYVAASETRKRELQERYGFRRLADSPTETPPGAADSADTAT